MSKRNRQYPPRIGEKLFRFILPESEWRALLGDYEELYKDFVQRRGQFIANLWYILQIVLTIPSVIWDSIKWSVIMIRNYMKIALRNIKKHKGFSFINITGLSIGLTCTILMLAYVHHELSYDRFHKNAENIYKVICKTEGGLNALSPGALKSAVLDGFPEVINAARVCPWGGYLNFNGSIRYEGNRYIENRFFIVDQEFLDIFTFPLISGNPQKALSEPFSIVLTQEMAEKYFGNEDPMGRILKFDNKYDYKITGILKEVPVNSHFMFDFLVSINTMYYTSYRGRKSDLVNWGHYFSATYIQLEKECNPDILESKLQTLVKKHTDERSEHEFFLQPLTKIYLNPMNPPIGKSSDIRYVYLFSGIAFINMLIACFNYMNLATARSSNRINEVGIRRVVGANRFHLIRQFFSESFLYVVISLLLSILLVKLFLPAFGSLIDRDLNFALLNDSWILPTLICITLLVGIIAGSYPALFLTSLSPFNILKGGFKISKKRSTRTRNSLVIIQFVFSIALIICTFFIYNQLNYIKNTNLGFSRDYIVVAPVAEMNSERDYETLKNKLSQHSQIIHTSVSSKLPSLITGGGSARWEGKTDENIRFTHGFVDYNFLDLYGMELLEGRNFSKGIHTDVKQAYILNEKAVKAIGWKAPIGKRFNQGREEDGVVIGVIDDFHFLPLHRRIEPLVLSLIQNEWEEARFLSIKISSNDITSTLSFVEEKFREFSPDYSFSYSFFNNQIDRMYRSERKLGQSFITFTLIAVFIACLGLLGLASFTAEQRTKEIGIRKVLGASVPGIFVLLSREFTKWIVLANIIAWPIAYYFMNKWLQNFAYRISLSVWIFILSGLTALCIALLTISYQAIKAARASPIEALKYE